MDGIVVVCALILNPRARRRREAALSAFASDNISPSTAASGTQEVEGTSHISEKSEVLDNPHQEDLDTIDIERDAGIKTSRDKTTQQNDNT